MKKVGLVFILLFGIGIKSFSQTENATVGKDLKEKGSVIQSSREAKVEKWQPNGTVNLELRYWGEVENHDDRTGKIYNEKTKKWAMNKKDPTWAGQDEWMQIRTTTNINLSPSQSLLIHTRNRFGIDSNNNNNSSFERTDITYNQDLGKLGSTKIDMKSRNMFTHRVEGKWLETSVVFDFSEYFSKGKYIKVKNMEISPFYRYDWIKGDKYTNNVGFYALAAFELPFGMNFHMEFDDLFNYAKINNGNSAKTGSLEAVLGKDFVLYKKNKSNFKFGTTLSYLTDWAYNKKSVDYDNGLHGLNAGKAGTARTDGSKELWGSYSLKLSPYFLYTYKATDFVTLNVRFGAEYRNRIRDRHEAKYWRWQPYARIGLALKF